MRQRLRDPRVLPGLALALLLALAAWPGTRWLVAYQVRGLVSRPYGLYAAIGSDPSLSDAELMLGFFLPDPISERLGGRATWRESLMSRRTDRPLRQAASRRRTDWMLQLGHFSMSPVDTEQQLAAAFRLADRYPDQPALWAHVLRIGCLRGVRLSRPEESWLTGYPATFSSSKEIPFRTTCLFQQAADQGERVDPDNAFFPYMRAVCQFAQRRDADALASIERAAGKSRWDDYSAAEDEARWRLITTAYGRQPACARFMLGFSTLVPHLAPQRGAARVAAYLALRSEQAGDAAGGLRIRRALLRCGGLMRAHCPSGMGAAVGAGVERSAITRPGGGPMPTATGGATAEQLREQRLGAYANYLVSLGHGREAEQVRRQLDDSGKAAALLSDAAARMAPWRPGVPLLVLWPAGLLALTAGVWLLIVSVAAGWVHRRWGRGAGLVPLMSAAGGVLGVLAVLLRERVAEISQAGLWLAACTLFHGYIDPPQWVQTAAGPISTGCAALAVVLPMLLLFLFALRGRPADTGAAAHLARRARVLGCLCLVIYTGLAVATAHCETDVAGAMDRMARHEGPYLAKLQGKTWSGLGR